MGTTDRLELTEDEAYALLGLCMTSQLTLDPQSRNALNKLASFCKSHINGRCTHTKPVDEELEVAG